MRYFQHLGSRSHHRLPLHLLLLLLVADQLSACLWDYDTLAMERRRFPEAHELIAGYFLRHTDAYYKWRLADRLAKTGYQRTPGDFDDIAVAYEKLGQHEEAIATIREKMKHWPNDGRYESEANLGTFLIHAGRYKEGLEHITRAIEINPDAHFGRERYQQRLVEYVLETREAHQGLPLCPETTAYVAGKGFAAFILSETVPNQASRPEQIEAAIKGVLGMMRFGRHDSPILLEALGDLLLSIDLVQDSKMLAARAYLKASYEVDDVEVSYCYRMKAKEALDMQYGRKLEEIEADLQEEVAQGFRLFLEIASNERAWVVEECNLDEEFASTYAALPKLKLNRPDWSPREGNSTRERQQRILGYAVGFCAAAACLVLIAIYVRTIWLSLARTNKSRKSIETEIK